MAMLIYVTVLYSRVIVCLVLTPLNRLIHDVIKPRTVIGSNNHTMNPTIHLILAVYFLPHSLGCNTGLQYVEPTSGLDCLPCEKDAVSWPLGVKILWFIIRVWSMGHVSYDCCKVEVERRDSAQMLRSRHLQSDPNCGLKGRPRRWRKKHAENQTEEDIVDNENEEKEERIVKDGRNPSRIVGGTWTARGEIPWQVALLKEDFTTWDGCGGLLLSCDPVIIVTAAHCVHKFGIRNIDFKVYIYHPGDNQSK